MNIIATVKREDEQGHLGAEYTKLAEIGGGIAHCIRLNTQSGLNAHNTNVVIVCKKDFSNKRGKP